LMKAMNYKCSHQVAAQIQASFKVLSVYAFTRGPVVVKSTFCPDFPYSWGFYSQFNTVWHWLQPPPPYQLKPSAILPRHPGDQQAPRRHWPERSPALLAVRPMPD